MKLWRRALGKVSGRYLFGYTVAMFTLGAVPVFVAFFATNGASASTIVIVTVTSVLMLGIAAAIAAAGNALRRRLLGSADDSPDAPSPR